MTLSDLLNQKKCIKLVCGAGNEDFKLIEKLVAVYAKAGAHYFDLSPNEEVLLAVKSGIARVIPKNKIKDYFICVSVGVAGDPHVMKAVIDPKKCTNCGACALVCLQNAIKQTIGDDNRKYHYVLDKKCIGCDECAKACKFGAIEFVYKKKDLKTILPPLIKMGIDSIELHAVTEDEKEPNRMWQEVSKIFPGILSLCLDRLHLGDEQLLNRIKRFIEKRKDFTTIVQADGAPMSGSSDSNNTTLQAIATTDIVQKANLPVWILMSGGTNSKTTKLAKMFDVKASGISLGSYARKIISDELNRDDFFENKEVFNSAYKKAKKLINVSLKYLG